MSNPKTTRTEPATEVDQSDTNIGGDQPAANTTSPARLAAEIDAGWNAMTPAERAAQQRQDRLEYMTEHAFFALLHNPRFEQIARLPVADPTRQGAGLYDYASRLVDGYLTAQESAK